MNRRAVRGKARGAGAAPAGRARPARANGAAVRERAPARRGPVGAPRSIDDLDRAIIEALQENGREPFRRIAQRVGVTEATVRTRYARLTEASVLQVAGVTNPLALGFESMAMLGVRVSGAPEPVADELSEWREISYLVITAGQYDLLVELVCADHRHLRDLTNRIRALPGVASTETFVYLELYKQLYDWGTRSS
jgi:Lrp/AsnC family transcriptional regulator, regulator for asnA, asnC and gidA